MLTLSLPLQGALDLLVIRSLPTTRTLSVTSVFNNLFLDAFFLKALGLNGVCVSDCPTGQRYRKPKPFGVNAHGPTFTFTVTQMNGQRRLAHGTQLSQASHLALETPYQLFGLGRTNNYIEMVSIEVKR
jgi:integrin alpha FG-GAP repeat containing protein 1